MLAVQVGIRVRCDYMLQREWGTVFSLPYSPYATSNHSPSIQYHTPPSFRGPALESFPELKEAGLPALPYDGVVEIVVKDVADFAKARQDPFYKEYVIPDEEKMVDRGNASWAVGWEEVKIDIEGFDRDFANKVRGS